LAGFLDLTYVEYLVEGGRLYERETTRRRFSRGEKSGLARGMP